MNTTDIPTENNCAACLCSPCKCSSPANDFAAMSAESPLRDAIQVLPNEGEACPVLGHDDNPEAGQPIPYVRAFPTWEDGMAFLKEIHEEIAEKKFALLNRRGEGVEDICYV